MVRAGWYLGEAGEHRFEPSQALAMGLRREEAVLTLGLSADEEATLRYLKGETLIIDAPRLERSAEADSRSSAHERLLREDARNGSKKNAIKGYVLVCADHFPIGWGKVGGEGLVKNELPAGWRRM